MWYYNNVFWDNHEMRMKSLLYLHINEEHIRQEFVLDGAGTQVGLEVIGGGGSLFT